MSQPVPIDRIERWVDRLAELGTSVVACSGGEPLLHPQLERLIRRVRDRGMIAGLITNGYLLSEKRIESLNEAGLDFLQISIDNVEPDAVSKKSLRLLDGKLEWLSRYAEFDVNINSVLGAGISNPEDARTINETGDAARLLHLDRHHPRRRAAPLKPLGPAEREVWDEVSGQVNGLRQLLKNLYTGIRGFQQNLADGKPNDWRCRAGARYFYVCEEGLVHLCSQQRGYPAIPLERYGVEQLRREFDYAQTVRALLHDRLRAPRLDDGLLEKAADGRAHRAKALCRPLRLGKRSPEGSVGTGLQACAAVRCLSCHPSTSRPRSTSRKSTTPSTRPARK